MIMTADFTALPPVADLRESDLPLFHAVCKPFGVVLTPITASGENVLLALDETLVVSLTYEAASYLLAEINQEEN